MSKGNYYPGLSIPPSFCAYCTSLRLVLSSLVVLSSVSSSFCFAPFLSFSELHSCLSLLLPALPNSFLYTLFYPWAPGSFFLSLLHCCVSIPFSLSFFLCTPPPFFFLEMTPSHLHIELLSSPLSIPTISLLTSTCPPIHPFHLSRLLE